MCLCGSSPALRRLREILYSYRTNFKHTLNFQSKKDILFLVLTGFFVTNALVAEMIGGKLIQIGPFTQSVGILPWPVVFLAPDLTNEYFGKRGVRAITFITIGLISYTFLLLWLSMQIPAVDFSPISQQAFNMVFGTGMYMIVGSLLAFTVSQLMDVFVFWVIRGKTGANHVWLRATGSTVVAQLFDTFIVQFVAFVVPGVWTLSDFLKNASFGYVFKLGIALALIPLIYVGHALIDRYLGEKQAEKMIHDTAEKNLGHKTED